MLGIERSIRTMTEAEKIELRYVTTMRMAKNAMNDYERTQDSVANGIRILREQVVILAQSFGAIFMPLMEAILPPLIAFVQLLNQAFLAIAKLFGYTAPSLKDVESSANAVGGMSDDLDNATSSAKKLRDYMLGIDELNVINPNDDAGSGSDTGVGSGLGIDFDQFGYEQFVEKVSSQIDAIKEKILSFFKVAFEPFAKSWANYGKPVMDAFKRAGEATKDLWDHIVKVFKSIWEGGLADIIEKLSDIVLILVELFMRLYADVLVPIGKVIADIFDPNKNPFVKAFLDLVNVALEGIKKVLEWLGMDGYEFVTRLVGGFVMLAVILGICAGLIAIASTPIGAIVLGITAIVAIVYILGDAWEWLKAKWTEIWVNHLQKYFTKEYWLELGENMKSALITKWTEFWKWFDNTWFGVFWNEHVMPLFTLEYWTNLGNNIKTALIGAWNSVSEWFNNTWFGQFWNNNVLPLFTKEYWVNVGSGLINGFKTIWKDAINGAIGMLNNFIDWVNDKLNLSLPGLEIGGVTIFEGFSKQLFKFPNIPYLARGGIVDSGTPFVAGEAGAEIIGSHQGKTTVMPLENTGFVTAMHEAVFNAVVGAMESSQGLLNVENVVNLDGEVLYRSNKKVEKQKGKPIMGGVW